MQHHMGSVLTMAAIILITVACPFLNLQNCSKCPGHDLSLLHKEHDTGHRFRPRRSNDSNGNVNQENPPAPTMVPHQGAEQGVQPQASNNHQAAITSTEVSTAQVLLNVVPVTVTVEDGNSLSTYAFLDNGCTDTLIDREPADRLNLKGNSKQTGMKTIRGSEESVETQRVSFTLSPVEGCGSDIEVDEAYVLSYLNQTEQVSTETVDVSEYPQLEDLTFTEDDLHQVSIVGNNVPAAHFQNEVGVPPDNNGPYGYRFQLG